MEKITRRRALGLTALLGLTGCSTFEEIKRREGRQTFGFYFKEDAEPKYNQSSRDVLSIREVLSCIDKTQPYIIAFSRNPFSSLESQTEKFCENYLDALTQRGYNHIIIDSVAGEPGKDSNIPSEITYFPPSRDYEVSDHIGKLMFELLVRDFRIHPSVSITECKELMNDPEEKEIEDFFNKASLNEAHIAAELAGQKEKVIVYHKHPSLNAYGNVFSSLLRKKFKDKFLEVDF